MIDFDNIEILEGGRMIDPRSGLLFPWYTKPFLQELCSWNIKDWRVFEYGAGDSTFWWRENCREVISVDSNKEWADKCGVYYETDEDDFIKFPSRFVEKEKFDCIIIDGEPVEWRDKCSFFASAYLKDDGKIIIDNYKQPSVKLKNWPITDHLFEERKRKVYPQEGHPDWKTACFNI